MSSLVDTEASARAAIARLGDARQLPLDVEGDGLFGYRAQLCTVQLCAGDDVVVVDTIAVDPDVLAPLVEGDAAEKIVHDASFDVRLLRDVGLDFGRLFDTSVAARFLGEPATGLASLVKKYLNVSLRKEKQQADWGKRPIDAEGLVYLENDVLYLEELADLLRDEIEDKDIGLEVAEESAWVVSSAYDEAPDTRVPWVRIKGAFDLMPPDQAILREVAAVREAAAERMNVPPFKVVRNDILFELVKRKPRDNHQASKIHGITRGRARRLMRELVDAVQRGLDEDAPPAHELPRTGDAPPPEVREAKRKLHRSLSKWRKKEAAARDVDSQVVLPGHCLGDVVARTPRSSEELSLTPGFGEFRVERYGEAILRLVAKA